MARLKTALITTALAAAALSAGTAQATYNSSLCEVSVNNSRDGSGFIVATVSPGLSGYYELDAAQLRPGGAIDMSQSGPFDSRSRGRTVLSRAYVSTLYNGPRVNGPEGPNGVTPAQFGVIDGRYGLDVRVAATLRVYDRNGRLICNDDFNNISFGRNRFGR